MGMCFNLEDLLSPPKRGRKEASKKERTKERWKDLVPLTFTAVLSLLV